MHPDVSQLSVIGLGKLGAPMAACLAHAGFTVVGADSDKEKVAALRRGRAPVFEPGLQELLAEVEGRLRTTQDARAAVESSEATFVIVPTPSDPDGSFSLDFVLSACEVIGRALSRIEEFHTVVITSTVLPGSTGGPVRKALEEASGKRAGVDFGLCYSPEFVALGSVIRDLRNPDFVLIGESDPRAGDILASVFARLRENDPPLVRMGFVDAELAKLAVNTFVTTKITFANTLARICERLPGADVDRVTAALGLDGRIGARSLRGAVGYGGPCFPRDNLAFAHLARNLGVRALLAEATDRANRESLAELAALVIERLPRQGTVGLLGLAYKPGTDVVEESPGLLLAGMLVGRGVSVLAFDPAATEKARAAMGGEVQFVHSLESCVEGADVIVVATPWEEFRHLDPALLARAGKPPLLIDCWRVLERTRFEGVAEYVALGEGMMDGSEAPGLGTVSSGQEVS